MKKKGLLGLLASTALLVGGCNLGKEDESNIEGIYEFDRVVISSNGMIVRCNDEDKSGEYRTYCTFDDNVYVDDFKFEFQENNIINISISSSDFEREFEYSLKNNNVVEFAGGFSDDGTFKYENGDLVYYLDEVNDDGTHVLAHKIIYTKD